MRSKRACDSCHGRKIQCDAAVPQCNWCKHHGMACTFNRAARVKKKATVKRKSPENDISARVEQIEKTLKGTHQHHALRYMPQGTYGSSFFSSARHPPVLSANALCSNLDSHFSRPSENHTQALCCAFDQPRYSGIPMGCSNPLNSIPLFSENGQEWIHSTEGEDPSFQKLLSLELPWQILSQDVAPLILESPHCGFQLDLPDRSLIEECLSIFVSSQFAFSLPLIDPILFQLNIDLAFDTRQYQPSQKVDSAKACIFAFIALLSLFQHDWRNLPCAPIVAGDAFASAAERIISYNFQDTSVVALQILFMLSFYHNWSGHTEQGVKFHALSCRLVFKLGGHAQPSYSAHELASEKTLETVAMEYTRNIFWLCYELDKGIALRTGQPPVINDDYCDLTLPHNDYNSEIQTMATKRALISSVLRPSHLQLSIIKSKVSRALYSQSALRKSDAEVFMNIRELDKELEEWRMSFPQSCRPPLTFPSEINMLPSPNAKYRPIMEEILLNLEYHYLVGAIHRATRRVCAWGSSQAEKLNGISSSLVLSVQASRSAILYLRAAIFGLEEITFWIIMFYPISAVTCIICNILLKPQSPRARDDLALLRSVPDLIKGMRKRHLTLTELAHIKQVDEFVAEVIKLGNYAIAKTLQEKEIEPDGVVERPYL